VHAQQEPVLVNDQAGGEIAIQSERVLLIQGFAGAVALRAGKDGALRYEVRALDNRREPRPIALWSTGSQFQLVPLVEPAEERLLVEIAVPPELEVELEISDSRVQVNGLRSSVTVRGSGLDVEGHGIYGYVVFEGVETELSLDGVEGDLDVSGSKLKVDVRRLLAGAVLKLQESEADLHEVAGEADLDLTDTTFAGTQLTGGCRVGAVGGSVRIEGAARQTDLILEESPAEVTGSIGLIVIDTDSDVSVSDIKGKIKLTGFGGRIRGSGSTAPLEIDMDDAQVTLDEWQGQISVRGDRLGLMFRQLTGAVSATTTGSNVTIETVDGDVTIENDFGDVKVTGVTGAAKIVNRDGITAATDLSGSLDLQGSGERIDVSWIEVPTGVDHVIHNENGSVFLTVPTRARCRLDVRSEYGFVRSQLSAVRVSDDQQQATALLGGASQPTIEVRASGDIRLAEHNPPPPRQ
jgi:hypothetical protein